MDEGYYPGALIYRALAERGYRYPEILIHDKFMWLFGMPLGDT
jgi:hypothetical protein